VFGAHKVCALIPDFLKLATAPGYVESLDDHYGVPTLHLDWHFEGAERGKIGLFEGVPMASALHNRVRQRRIVGELFL
jgi:hypothetical protein